MLISNKSAVLDINLEDDGVLVFMPPLRKHVFKAAATKSGL